MTGQDHIFDTDLRQANSPFNGSYDPVLTHVHYGRSQVPAHGPGGVLHARLLHITTRHSTEEMVPQAPANIWGFRWGFPVFIRRCAPNTRCLSGKWGNNAPMIEKVNSKPPQELPRYSFAVIDTGDLLAKAQQRAVRALYGR